MTSNAPTNMRFLALSYGEAELLESLVADEVAALTDEDALTGQETDDMTATFVRLDNRLLRILAKFQAQP